MKQNEDALKGQTIDRSVDKAFARFAGVFGKGPDAPYPGMIEAFENHYGQDFRDKDWRKEAACWAASWHRAVHRPAPASVPESQAALDVLAERRRQTEVEGWTPEHDDEHKGGQLALAAACYALNAAGCGCEVARNWPWDGSWWKPTTSRRDLVKAGALILAEIERLDRMTERQEGK